MKISMIMTTVIRYWVVTDLSIRYVLQLLINISNITFFFQDDSYYNSDFMLNSAKMNELRPKDLDEARESSTMAATRDTRNRPSVSIINDF